MNLKKYIVSAAIAVSATVSAQTTLMASHYSEMYKNQAPSAVVASKFMAAKDLIDTNINAMMSDPVLRNANWGFVIYDPATKKIISSYNESSAFVPASTTKLLTTETAMSLLGPKFRWVTQLEHSGSIDESGVLNGNLYIVGSGDPLLGSGKSGTARYTDLVSDFLRAMSSRGIRRVNGNIVIQTAVFKENNLPALPANVVWLERPGYYLPVGDVQSADPRNERAVVRQNSPFQDEKRYFYQSGYTGKMVSAAAFSGGTVSSKIPAAPSYLATALRSAMLKSGMPVTGQVITKMVDTDPEQRSIITAYKSPMLADIIYDTNQRSDNANAEAILRMVGFQRLGDQSLESGRAAVMTHLKEINFDTRSLNYMDGSGLSKSNYVTPISQAKFLAALMNEPYYREFQSSLPIAGQSGTLKKMFFGQSYGQIFAKTGTLNKVKCLAGYIKTNSGKTLTFSMLVNNYSGSVDQVKARMETLLNPAVDL